MSGIQTMVEGIGASKLVRKASRQEAKLDADRVKVTFSPEVLGALARLESAVRSSEHFSSDIFPNLQEYAAGKPVSVQSALSGIAFFTTEAMKHVNATGDERTKKALDELIGTLLGLNDAPPFTLTEVRTKSRQR
jgi:hypothetical protein